MFFILHDVFFKCTHMLEHRKITFIYCLSVKEQKEALIELENFSGDVRCVPLKLTFWLGAFYSIKFIFRISSIFPGQYLLFF